MPTAATNGSNNVQVYDIVNEVASQSIGKTAIKVVDTNSLVALGEQVFASNNSVEGFTNTLVQRIGRTIISFRAYTNQLRGIVMDDMEWGRIVQKVKVEMPTATPDMSYELTDGESVDMFIVNRPKTKQKFFSKNTPYDFYVTIQRFMLKEAFLSAGKMESFLAAVYGEVRNALELAMENQGKLCVANYIGNTKAAQVLNLVTMYNTASGQAITANTAVFDNAFLRWATGIINLYRKRLTSMSVQYNSEGETRHTPFAMQVMMLAAEFETAIETQVSYAAFHNEYVRADYNLSIPYWQAEQNPLQIDVTNSGGKEVKIQNVIGFLFDRDALGCFRREDDVLTTPVNARARYFNTFWHETQSWFNDMSENGIVFTLN